MSALVSMLAFARQHSAAAAPLVGRGVFGEAACVLTGVRQANRDGGISSAAAKAVEQQASVRLSLQGCISA